MAHIELVDPVTLAKAVNNLESLHLDLGANADEGGFRVIPNTILSTFNPSVVFGPSTINREFQKV